MTMMNHGRAGETMAIMPSLTHRSLLKMTGESGEGMIMQLVDLKYIRCVLCVSI